MSSKEKEDNVSTRDMIVKSKESLLEITIIDLIKVKKTFWTISLGNIIIYGQRCT